jgi:hypothetical protein
MITIMEIEKRANRVVEDTANILNQDIIFNIWDEDGTVYVEIFYRNDWFKSQSAMNIKAVKKLGLGVVDPLISQSVYNLVAMRIGGE